MNKLLISLILLFGCSSSYNYETKTDNYQSKMYDELIADLKTKTPCEKDSELTPGMSLGQVKEILGKEPDLTSYRLGYLILDYKCNSYYMTRLLSLDFEKKNGFWHLSSWNSLGI